jgi:hypothetical protein
MTIPPATTGPITHDSASGWLNRYLWHAVSVDLCTKFPCTTCGATEFTAALLRGAGASIGRPQLTSFDRESFAELLRALSDVEPHSQCPWETERAVRSILYLAWRGLGEHEFNELSMPLEGKWAGGVLAKMRAHYQSRLEAHRAHEEANAPCRVTERRIAHQEQRQQQHAERTAEQRERSRVWHEEHGGEHAG